VSKHRRLRLAFVSTLYLLPADAGGKIRTANVLRGLKGGAFEITLIGAGPPPGVDGARWQGELDAMADHVHLWPAPTPRPRWMRAADLLRPLPASVCNGIPPEAHALVQRLLTGQQFDVVVFDFVHASVLMPAGLQVPSVCFTHNVETEILARHAQQAGSAALRCVWRSQAAKMRRFERAALARYTRVIAVSERDVKLFAEQAGIAGVRAIPTAVDLDFFAWQPPAPLTDPQAPALVFTGSMDWAANLDGIRWFLAEVWPRVRARMPGATLQIVGRSPPPALLRQVQALPGVECTGFVDDVRPRVRAAQVFVIPLRVGGGTRIKVFEAMAMGCPVVSTTLGIEGLDVQDGVHCLRRDSAEAFADGVAALADDAALRERMSHQARQLVESRFGHLAAARVFEQVCLDAAGACATGAAAAASSDAAGAALAPRLGEGW
jgi:polysaccharide biosynthesis protein PslH